MSKRKFSLIALLVLLSVTFLNIEAFSQKIPSVSVWTNKKSYSPGESGVLYIKFKPGSGVKIPKNPSIKVTLSNKNVTGTGLQDYSGNGGGEYLGNNTVKYNFTVPKDADGKVSIKGKVKFGYCSMDNGICKIGKKSFSKSIKIN